MIFPAPKPVRAKREFKRPAVKEQMPLEDVEQRTVIEWLLAHRIRHTAIVPDRRICKRLGYVPGVPDLIIFDRPPLCVDGKLYLGTAIEMKRRQGGTLRPDQKEWIAALMDIGWACKVAKGCDEAIAFLEGLGYGQR